MSTNNSNSGLVALGKAGRLNVEVDEYENGNYSVTINSRTWSVRFNWEDKIRLNEIARFLHSNENKCAFSEIVLGSFGSGLVWLIKDNEFADRFFLRVVVDQSMFDTVLINDDAKELKQAIAEAAKDYEK